MEPEDEVVVVVEALVVDADVVAVVFEVVEDSVAAEVKHWLKSVEEAARGLVEVIEEEEAWLFAVTAAAVVVVVVVVVVETTELTFPSFLRRC